MLAKDPITRTYSFRPDVVATMLDDGAVLLDLESKFFYRLNRTGWIIAQRFELGATLGEVDDYCRRLGAGADEADAIAAVVDLLVSDGLTAPIDATGQPDEAVDGPDAGAWATPTIEKQAEPLQRIIISAFDPSVPLVE